MLPATGFPAGSSLEATSTLALPDPPKQNEPMSATQPEKLRAWRSHRQALDGRLEGHSPAEVLEQTGWARSVGGSAPGHSDGRPVPVVLDHLGKAVVAIRNKHSKRRALGPVPADARSEERRVGKECR